MSPLFVTDTIEKVYQRGIYCVRVNIFKGQQVQSFLLVTIYLNRISFIVIFIALI